VVYVISKDSKPLMPTKRHRKVRRLLKQGLAKVVRREPFTIQLLYDTTTYTQPVIAGMDTGSKTAGVSAITDKQKLFSIEVELRQDIKKLLLERREYRRNRRYGKTRYRKPKDANHVSTIGWHIVNRLKQQYDVEIAFGSITKAKRTEMGLEKTHRNDAFVIAGCSKDINRATEWYFGKYFRRQNTSLHKANILKGSIRKRNTIKEVKGFRRFDKVRYKNQIGTIYDLRSSGYFDIRTLSGEKIHSSTKYQDLKVIERAKTLILERRNQRTFLHLKEDEISCAGL